MKALVRQKAGYYFGFLKDENDSYLAETVLFSTEQEAREACRKYFPQFKLEGDMPGLPESWCVLNDGSKDFGWYLKPWLYKYDPEASQYGYNQGMFYGVKKGCIRSDIRPFGTVLSLSEFKAMIS